VARFLQARESEPPRHVTVTVGLLSGGLLTGLSFCGVVEVPTGDFVRAAQPRTRLYAAAKALRCRLLTFMLLHSIPMGLQEATALTAESRDRLRF
jgi:hypothetical protein